jgi:hypothetical protein
MADAQTFLKDLQSDKAEVRFAAWRRAGEVPPTTILDLGRLAASSNPGVSKAAREALITMVHSVGKDAASPNRAAVVKGLLELTAKAHPLSVRVQAARLLSNIAPADSVPSLAKHLTDVELREEAITPSNAFPPRFR